MSSEIQNGRTRRRVARADAWVTATVTETETETVTETVTVTVTATERAHAAPRHQRETPARGGRFVEVEPLGSRSVSAHSAARIVARTASNGNAALQPSWKRASVAQL